MTGCQPIERQPRWDGFTIECVMNAGLISLICLAAGLVALSPASRAAAVTPTEPAQASAGHVRPQAVAESRLHAVALSYRAQYLAWIAPRAGKSEVMLARWDGSDAHELAVPGDCDAAGIRWAPSWNKLAVLTHCRAGASDPAGLVHSVIWVVDVHAGGSPRKLADFSGLASCLQWTRDAEHIAFLYAPRATRGRHASAPCVPGHGAHGRHVKTVRHVAMVAATGGGPKAITPPSLNVYTYRLSPTGQRIAYTATAASGQGAHPVARLYAQRVNAGKAAAPRVIVDPAKATGALHDEWIAQPRWPPSGARILFLAGNRGKRGLAGRDLYTVSLSGGALFNLSASRGIKPAWFRFLGERSLLVTRMVDGRVRLDQCVFAGGSIRVEGTWFTVPEAIGNGRAPLAVSLVLDGRPTIAYAQLYPGHGVKIHSGVMAMAPAPVVATE